MTITRFVNQLMSSNCYLLEESNHCIVIDPGSEKSEEIIEFLRQHDLELDYILLTHEHSDHTWGVNSLLEYAPSALVICSVACKDELPTTSQAYFKFYYNDEDYHYNVKRVDKTIEEIDYHLLWNRQSLNFISTPGHSRGSICITINDLIFSGDTLMQSKPFMNKRDSNWTDYANSISLLLNSCSQDTMVYPGHGDPFPINNVYISNKIKDSI